MVDFLDFELGDSLLLSVEESLLGDFSVLASDFLVLVFVESALLLVESALLFFSLVFFEDGLVALSESGFFEAGDLVVEAFVDVVGEGFTVALADGVMDAETDAAGVAAGVMVAPTLAAGVALAFVDAFTPVVVVPVVVAPEVEVTPTLKVGVMP